MHRSLKDKHAIVTGAAHGIGRAIAAALVSAGCRVLVTDVDDEALGSLPGDLSGCHAAVLDVRSMASVREVLGGVEWLDILVNGEWVNLLRVGRSGVLSRHRHPAPVHGYVIRGSWRYLEHDWVAREGMYVYEPPGEVHTLVVDDDVEEMITLFHVSGALIYYDEHDRPVGHDDVHTKIAMCERHFVDVGLGGEFVGQFVR